MEHFTHTDTLFMQRALRLAARGLGNVSPNPMVGAVIVHKGRILGEGYHRCYGGGHAEVNAFAAVAPEEEHLLHESTMYVSLEPCSHFGKTPPCSDLILRKGIPAVVIAAIDPFEKVSGRGVARLREHGVNVRVGLLEAESRSLNARFITARQRKRPFVMLKWAQSTDGFMDYERCDGVDCAFRFSTALGTAMVHRLRSLHDAIAVGSGTVIADKPRLDVRAWHGKSPRKFVFDRRGRLGEPTDSIPQCLDRLYEEGVTSLLVEGGATLLQSFIDEGLWDVARVETASVATSRNGIAPAPELGRQPFRVQTVGKNQIFYYSNNPLVNDYFVDNAM